MKPQLMLRIVVVGPPSGATFAVQQGRTDLLAPINVSASSLIFEFPVSVADAASDPPRLTGEFAQGPPSGRFVYVNSGTLAGQTKSCWTRRAKVPLTSISKTLLRSALTGSRILEARVFGKARDGGPACATVPLLVGWALADRSSPAT